MPDRRLFLAALGATIASRAFALPPPADVDVYLDPN